MSGVRLNRDQIKILTALNREPGDGWARDHQVDRATGMRWGWAYWRLFTLRKRGLVEHSTPWWRITEAGRLALAEASSHA